MEMPTGQISDETSTDTSTPPPASLSDEGDRTRGMGEFIREAWGQALVAVSATEEEVQKIVGRVTNWVEMGPEEARRLGVELSDRLRRQRDELESSVETAVRKAVAPFRLPSREDLSALHARLTALEVRLDRAIEKRSPGPR